MSLWSAINGPRGIRVSFTRTCKLQVTADNNIAALGDPVPFGSLDPLRSRSMVYLKYMRSHAASGTIFLRGDPGHLIPQFSLPTDSYPIRNLAAESLEMKRRNRFVALPVTHRVPMYIQIGSMVEGTEALEF